MNKLFAYLLCVILLVFCMGCVENKQETNVENVSTTTPISEEDIIFIDNFAKELDETKEIASYVNQMEVLDYYSQPKAAYIFSEEVFYMNESERAKVEFTDSLIHFNRTPIHFINLNKIEEFGDTKYGRSHLNSIVAAAFTPMWNVEDEQLNCIIFSRNILFKHCLSDEHWNRLENVLRIVDTWGQFRYSMIHANVPMNKPDENRTFSIDNVEDMNVILKSDWKKENLEQYFEFLDESGFNSSEELLTFARQFIVAKKCIDDDTSESRQNQIYDAREFIIENFPQYEDNGIQESDMRAYLELCDKKE